MDASSSVPGPILERLRAFFDADAQAREVVAVYLEPAAAADTITRVGLLASGGAGAGDAAHGDVEIPEVWMDALVQILGSMEVMHMRRVTPAMARAVIQRGCVVLDRDPTQRGAFEAALFKD